MCDNKTWQTFLLSNTSLVADLIQKQSPKIPDTTFELISIERLPNLESQHRPQIGMYLLENDFANK